MTSHLANLGLLLLRAGVGFSVFYYHGLGKIMNPEKWERIGADMTLIGIDFWPKFWGLLASLAESAGAALIVLGLFTRPAAFVLAFTMLMAVIHHISLEERFSHPMELGFVFLALLLTGAGKYSLDGWWRGGH